MSAELSKNILANLAYYDVMDYPMTSFEIWKYLTKVQSSKFKVQSEEEKHTLCDIIKELENENLKKKIEEYRGFFFLKAGRILLSRESGGIK